MTNICAICQYPATTGLEHSPTVPEEVMVLTTCTHLFHEFCLKSFLRGAENVELHCPICRKDITSELAGKGIALTAEEIDAIRNSRLVKEEKQARVFEQNARASEEVVVTMSQLGYEASQHQIQSLISSSTYQVQSSEAKEAFENAFQNVFSLEERAEIGKNIFADQWSNREIVEGYINLVVNKLEISDSKEGLRKHLFELDQPSMEDVNKEVEIFLSKVMSVEKNFSNIQAVSENYINILVSQFTATLTSKEMEDLKRHLLGLDQPSMEDVTKELAKFLKTTPAYQEPTAIEPPKAKWSDQEARDYIERFIAEYEGDFTPEEIGDLKKRLYDLKQPSEEDVVAAYIAFLDESSTLRELLEQLQDENPTVKEALKQFQAVRP